MHIRPTFVPWSFDPFIIFFLLHGKHKEKLLVVVEEDVF
jgi:hypothetical protein